MSLKESYLFLTALKQRFQRSLLGFMLGQQWQLCHGNTEDIKCWMISEESFTKAGKQSVPALHCDLKSHQPSSTPTKKTPLITQKHFTHVNVMLCSVSGLSTDAEYLLRLQYVRRSCSATRQHWQMLVDTVLAWYESILLTTKISSSTATMPHPHVIKDILGYQEAFGGEMQA